MEKYTLPEELYRFIYYVSIGPDGTIFTNKLDSDQTFVSRYYTPNLKVGALAKKFMEKLRIGKNFDTTKIYDSTSFVGRLADSGLRIQYPMVYSVMQAILIEATAIVYACDFDKELLNHIEEADFRLARENIKYVNDAIGGQDDYAEFISNLHEMEIAIGYIEKQVPMIQKEVESHG